MERLAVTSTSRRASGALAAAAISCSFVRGAPYNTFARMRREDPLAWCEYKGGQGYWSVTRHHDILELNRDTKLLSSARGIRMEDQTYEEYLARRTFQETDPPDHTRTRILVAKAFSQPVIAQFAEQIRKLCDDILDTALAKGAFDATKEIARLLCISNRSAENHRYHIRQKLELPADVNLTTFFASI